MINVTTIHKRKAKPGRDTTSGCLGRLSSKTRSTGPGEEVRNPWVLLLGTWNGGATMANGAVGSHKANREGLRTRQRYSQVCAQEKWNRSLNKILFVNVHGRIMCNNSNIHSCMPGQTHHGLTHTEYYSAIKRNDMLVSPLFRWTLTHNAE